MPSCQGAGVATGRGRVGRRRRISRAGRRRCRRSSGVGRWRGRAALHGVGRRRRGVSLARSIRRCALECALDSRGAVARSVGERQRAASVVHERGRGRAVREPSRRVLSASPPLDAADARPVALDDAARRAARLRLDGRAARARQSDRAHARRPSSRVHEPAAPSRDRRDRAVAVAVARAVGLRGVCEARRRSRQQPGGRSVSDLRAGVPALDRVLRSLGIRSTVRDSSSPNSTSCPGANRSSACAFSTPGSRRAATNRSTAAAPCTTCSRTLSTRYTRSASCSAKSSSAPDNALCSRVHADAEPARDVVRGRAGAVVHAELPRRWTHAARRLGPRLLPGGRAIGRDSQGAGAAAGSMRSQLALAWEQVASSLFVLHIRHATWGALSDANTQPFARAWGRRDG